MCVEYKVYADAEASDVVTCGYALTDADVDFTVKVEATGLQDSTWYYYQFSNCADPSQKSPIGRTRTAPGKLATNVPNQRFSIYSCSNYPNGFFSAYSGPVKNQDTDYVVSATARQAQTRFILATLSTSPARAGPRLDECHPKVSSSPHWTITESDMPSTASTQI